MAQAKICGIKTKAALIAAVEARARFIGFVFMPSARQRIDLHEVRHLSALIPTTIEKVGLFVDASNDEITQALECSSCDLIQLHGNETPRRLAEIKALTDLPLIKAICVATEADLVSVPAFEEVADYLLFDARLAGRPSGGNGIAFDWSILSGRQIRRPWMLAGGLKAANLAEAVRVTGARLLDVSSGVEDDKGVKDPQKIRDFVAVAAGL